MILASVAYSAIAAYIVSSVYHPKQGMVSLLAGLKRVSAKSVWVWVTVLLPLAWQVVAGAIDLGLGGNGFLSFSGSTFLLLLASYPFTFFFGGPLTEEPGWRGFATPRLQQKYTPLTTGLIIGAIWSTWHFPLYFTPFYGGGLAPFLFRFVYTIPLGIFFTWFYNRSGGNLFASMLLHTSVNTFSSVLFGGTVELIAILLMIVSAVIVVIYDKMYRKTENPLEPQMVKPAESKDLAAGQGG